MSRLRRGLVSDKPPSQLVSFIRATRWMDDQTRVKAFEGLPEELKAEIFEVNGFDPGRVVEALSGSSFILDDEDTVAVWGSGSQVLWSSGEPLWIVGQENLGKSSIAQNLVMARCGLWEPEFLGFEVAVDLRQVLYVAADRPKQIARSFKRMVSEQQREHLDVALTFLPDFTNPLSVDPDGCLEDIEEAGDIGTVVIDSLKDVANDLSKDSEGSKVNTALKNIIHSGREVVVLHHDRKPDSQQSPDRKPRLADVYGSRWLTAGAGSVLYLAPVEEGNARVKLHQLKTPLSRVGPLQLRHDFRRGRTYVDEGDF